MNKLVVSTSGSDGGPPESLPNILLVTLDSCRWDCYQRASMPFLNSLCQVKKAYAQATFTYASHMAMFQGILPHVPEPLPYYNRYVLQLMRIANRTIGPPSFISFDKGTDSIISGFRANGYCTIGIGAMEWFKHSHLTNPFEDFHFTGIHARKQMEILLDSVSQEPPFFALINFGETHDPYQYCNDSGVSHSTLSRARQEGDSPSDGFDSAGWDGQVRSCEYLDTILKNIISHIQGFERPTVVIVCGDHGECFGEDGLYGHGFYHQKIMEVLMAIFEINSHYLAESVQDL